LRLNGIQRKLYHITYDKPALNKKALQLRTSLDEVKKILGTSSPKKK